MAIVTGAQTEAQLDRTDASVMLLGGQIGDGWNEVRKRNLAHSKAGEPLEPLPNFPQQDFNAWFNGWRDYYNSVRNNVVDVNLGSTFTRACEWLKECHVWRQKAYKAGLVTDNTDVYEECPEVSPVSLGFGIGSGVAVVALLALGILVLSRRL